MKTQNQSHPSQRQLAALALGKLAAESRARLKEHVAGCATCSKFVSDTPRDTLVALLRGAKSATRAADQSTPGVRDRETLSGVLGLEKSAAGPAPQEKQAWPDPPVTGQPPSEPRRAAPADERTPRELREQSKYKIVRLLGRGGMGAVYEAFHQRMDRRVAIKIINPSLVDHPDALARFDREVKAAAKLDHVNVARAYDADEFGSLRVLVMEFVPGQDFDKFLRGRSRLTVVEACRLVRQAMVGLAHAHARGMVHRDLKPQNLMLTPDGKVKILDFGLAKIAIEQKQAQGLTRDNALMGTPHYMAPEQALDAAKADIRADIYSLGCTLYCLLTGTPPFDGDTEMKVLLAHQHDTPRPLCELVPEVPKELSDLVDRMLAKNPSARPQTPKEVAQALLPFAKGERQAAAKGAAEPFAFLADEEPRAVAVPTKVARSSRKPPGSWIWVAGAAGVLVTVLLVAWAIGVFSVRTSEGTIIVENVPADAVVLVDDDSVTISRDGEEVTITAVSKGDHHLRLVQNGNEIWTSDVAVTFGGQQVRVKYEAGRPLVVTPATPEQALPAKAGNVQPGPVRTNSIGMKLVTIPAGEFLMGSPEDEEGRSRNERQHRVTLTRPVEIGAYEVTGGQFAAFVEATDYRTDVEKFGRKDSFDRESSNTPRDRPAKFTWKRPSVGDRPGEQPVVMVSWNDATAFCAWLTEQEGRTYRLPTEAEWEYACRAGTVTRFHSGDDAELLVRVDNVADATLHEANRASYTIKSRDGFRGVAPVGQFQSNGFGLYDMHGNVREWCADLYETDYYLVSPAADPPGPATGNLRSLRGGHCFYDPSTGRSASRQGNFPSFYDNGTGFRVVCEIEATKGTDAPAATPPDPPIDVDDAGIAPINRIEANVGFAKTLPFLPGSHTVFVTSGRSVIAMDILTGKQPMRFGEHPDLEIISCVAISDDGGFLAVGGGTANPAPADENAIVLYDLKTNGVSGRFKGHTHRVQGVAFSPNGKRLLSGGMDKTVRLWDVESFRELKSYTTRASVGVAFLPDQRKAVLCFREQIRLRDLEHHAYETATNPGLLYETMALSPDGRHFLTGNDDGTLCVWRVGNLSVTRRPKGHTDPVMSVAWSPDGKWIVSGSGNNVTDVRKARLVDNSVRLWNSKTGREVAHFSGLGDSVAAVAFSPDGKYVVASSAYGDLVCVWEVPTAGATK